MVTISNPVVRGTQPDPSVVRVGADYFLATSSFELLPGIQIRHSTNLIDWELIGAAVRRPSQYRRDGRPGAVTLYAPTLRHYAGRFFLVCTNVADDQGNFLLCTSNPAGEWSDAVWIDEEAFDPSLLFDDDVCYYTRRSMQPLPDGRHGPVVQGVLDLETGRVGPMHELTKNHQGFCSNDIEGPHLYRIGAWYYLFSAEGGSWAGHMQTIARSRSPWGPFEPAPHNPVLTHRHRVAHPIQALGHAELVDDIHGRWWAVALGTRHTADSGYVQHHNLGRETFLAPVEWMNDWPVLGEAGTIELEMDVDRPSLGSPPAHAHRAHLWQEGWQALNAYPDALETDPASDLLLPFGAPLSADSAAQYVGALMLPQTENVQRFEGEVMRTDSGSVGAAVFADHRHFYSASVAWGPHGPMARLEKVVDDLRLVHEHPLEYSDHYRFVIDASAAAYRFTVRCAEGYEVDLGSGSARLLSAQSAENFVGVHFAVTAATTDCIPGTAQFTLVARSH